ncbi:DUF6920 family protein [Niallia oryzisoli]|uniref:DUF6920 family protein n=1 Tax=Niallia oryzisoli TaxID=1737571 RepID=UPI0037356CE7
MRIVFVFVVMVHGLIHSLGFLKAFHFAELNQLKLAISKPIGILWLVTAISFLFSVLLFMTNKNWWWMPSLLAILLSQTVISFSWQDAKVGTIANIMILIVTLAGYGSWQFHQQANKEIQQFLSEVSMEQTKYISEQELNSLPSIVQKWLHQTGIVGKEEMKTVYLKQRGQMKLKTDQKEWYRAEAEQYVRIEEPGFIWKVDMKMLPFVHVAGKDRFQEGNGTMTMKIGSLIPVVNVAGNKKVDESSLQRYLLELPIYPSAALQPYITWEEMDEKTAKAAMTYKGISGSAIFHFNNQGELVKISALRYKDSDEKAKRMECIGEIQDYEIMNGIKIPAKIDISWMLEEGKFTWYTLEIYDYQYNLGKGDR